MDLSPPQAQCTVRSALRPVVVTGVLVVHNGAVWLGECLEALSLQTRPPDRLVIVDTGSTDDSMGIAEKHARIRQVVGDVEMISAPQESTFGQAVGRVVRQLAGEPASSAPVTATPVGWLWLLHDDSAAAPDALAQLLDAARRSPSVAVAGPKLVTWDDPSRLLEVGTVVTRAGRRVGGPVAGEPDQGQHDQRSDVLGVSTSGMLIRQDVFEALRGFDPAFGQFCDDLDLCWRAQLAGHRVVVAPRARMREAAASTSGQRSADLSAEAAQSRERRHGRQVALARCSPFAAPLLAIWIALASLASAGALLVAKRPRGAWAALGDLGSLMTPWRPLGARRRLHGLRRVRRRDLRGLFASPRAGFGYTLDVIHEGVGISTAWPVDDGASDLRSLESGPAAEEAESLERPAAGAGWRILSHPGFLVVMAGVLVAAVSWRSLLGDLGPGGSGVAGGELLPATGSASELWHAWLDGWHGPGLGNALEPAPYLPVLAAAAWVLEHLPLIGATTSPVGVAIAWLLFAAIPLSAWTAYLAARVVTRDPWPRAWAALAWATLATLTTAVAGGRLGAAVAHILLPLVAAGFVCAARPSARSWPTFGAAVALWVAGVFNPGVAALGVLAAFALLVVGHGRTRLHAAVLLLVPIGLQGPWILQLADKPLLLLTGPGLTVWQSAKTVPWQLGLLHPGGPGSYPVLLSAPIVLAGVVAMSRREAGSRAMTVLAVIALAGLAVGEASPHVIIGRIPQDLAGAGGPITVWAGTGLDLAALALIAAALRGFGGYPGLARGKGTRRQWLSRLRWRQVLAGLVISAAVVGVAASTVMAAWIGSGELLTRQSPTMPVVAADQADGSWGNRLLVMAKDQNAIGYRLLGAEPGPLVRDLPGSARAPDPVLAAAVKSIVGTSDGASPEAAHNALADSAIGFVGFRGARTEPLVTQLDETAGITRLTTERGLLLWRVLPRENTMWSSRLRLVDASGAPLASIPVTGDHGRTEVSIGPASPATAAGGRRLVVAEPSGWAAHARVTFAGHRLAAMAGDGQPTYQVPATAGHLSVSLAPAHHRWRWAQLALLLTVLFLALPFGSARPGRTQ